MKSSPVSFYVQRYSDYFNTTGTPILFDSERLNVGGTMSLTSGKFTAPRAGTYAFSFTGNAYLPASSSRVVLYVCMYLNGNWIANGYADEVSSSGQYETLSFQSTLNLKAGDQIWLQIYSISAGAYLSGNYLTQFSGYLLDETLPQ